MLRRVDRTMKFNNWDEKDWKSRNHLTNNNAKYVLNALLCQTVVNRIDVLDNLIPLHPHKNPMM